MLRVLPEEYSGALWASCAAGRKQTQAELCKKDITKFTWFHLPKLSHADLPGCISTDNVATILVYLKISFGTSQGDVKQLWPTLDLTQEAKLCTQNVQTSLQQTLLVGVPMGLLPQNTESEFISIQMQITDGLNYRTAFIPHNPHCDRRT